MTKSTIINIFSKCCITLALIALGAWLVHFTWQERQVHYKNYTFSAEESKRLKSFPEVQYAFGRQAWLSLDTATAAAYFRQAVSRDVLYIEAWFRLAEAEAALGNVDKARAILAHTDSRVANVYRWKWSQMLLARELGLEDIFFRNINYMIAQGRKVQDTLQLLDGHLGGDVATAVKALHHDNIAPYLKWLMRWKRIDDTYAVWSKMAEIGEPDQDIIRRYVHFLVGHKRIRKAERIWQPHSGSNGITNAGFEAEITRLGFDWRLRKATKGLWEVQRVKTPVHAGSHALEVSFAGRENVSFHHLYQIVPVEPLEHYHLSFAWRSWRITTDQGPFVEIYGYGCKGIYYKSPMINGTNDWQTEIIEFSAPESCQAVIVRLRRKPSHRFDSKISGTLWLDDFRLEKIKSLSADYTD
jgi:hypothetical protein